MSEQNDEQSDEETPAAPKLEEEHALNEARLKAEIERAARHKRHLTMVLITGGDEALHGFIGEGLRSYDVAGQLGDGRMIVLLPEVDLKFGRSITERLAHTASDKGMGQEARFYVTTLSQAPEATPEAWLTKACKNADESEERVGHDDTGLMIWRAKPISR